MESGKENDKDKKCIAKLGGLMSREYTNTIDDLRDLLSDCGMLYESDQGKQYLSDDEKNEFKKIACEGLFNYLLYNSNGSGNYRQLKKRIDKLMRIKPHFEKAKGYHQMNSFYRSKTLEEGLKKSFGMDKEDFMNYLRYRAGRCGILANILDAMRIPTNYNPGLTDDFVRFNEEIEKLRMLGIDEKRFHIVSKEYRPISDKEMCEMALDYVLRGLEHEKMYLDHKKTSFSEGLLSDEGLKNHGALVHFIRKKCKKFGEKEAAKLYGKIKQCKKLIEERKAPLYEMIKEKRDEAYQKAYELAYAGHESYREALKDFENVVLKYSSVLKENENSFFRAHSDVNEAYLKRKAGLRATEMQKPQASKL